MEPRHLLVCVSPSRCQRLTPFRKGANLHIGSGSHLLCAVWAMLAYLSVQESTPGPLFILQDGHPLFCALLTDWLWQILSAVGISGNFFSSSFCIGVTTVAAHNGVPDRLIQSLGQW